MTNFIITQNGSTVLELGTDKGVSLDYALDIFEHICYGNPDDDIFMYQKVAQRKS